MTPLLQETPKEITASVKEFCKGIDPGQSPVFVKVQPVDQAKGLDCFENVKIIVAEKGGTIQHGWEISEASNIMLEAQFHAVWKNPQGQLLDVTPNETGTDQILFLPDSKRIYEGRLVPNHQKALIASPQLNLFITASRKVADFRVENEINSNEDEERLSEDVKAEYHSLFATMGKRYQDLVMSVREPSSNSKKKIGRNDPCPCGSGRKYKKCHGG